MLFILYIFCFSSKRRHRRCALVTGVQTCALPIWVKASAVAPAKPPITDPSPSLRTLRALAFITVCPSETCPSPATTTFPFLRTERMVVPCQLVLSLMESPKQLFETISEGGDGDARRWRFKLLRTRQSCEPPPSAAIVHRKSVGRGKR